MKLAVKFSSDYISITELKAGNTIRVTKAVRAKMPEGAFSNGIVVNTNVVANVLKEMLKENHIKTKTAVLCVSGMDAICKEIKIPKSAPRHVRGLIKNELLKTDSLRNGYRFDYILGENDEEDLQNYYVYLLPADLIYNYEQTMKRAGLTLERVEPVSRSMEKLSKLLGLRERGNLTILIDAEVTGFDILMTGRDSKSVYRNIQLEEENIEENVFIVSAIRNISENQDPLERSIQNLIEAVSKLLQFQLQSSSGKSVDQILIYGELAEQEEMIKRMEERTGIAVTHCRISSERIQFPEYEQNEAGSSYSTIGCSGGKLIGEGKQLSFIGLPDEADAMTLKDRIPLFVGLAAVVALAVSYTVISTQNMRYERRNADLEAQVASIEASEEYQRRVGVQQELLKLSSYNENCNTCIETLESVERFEAEEFRKVDALVPDGIAITGHEYEGNVIRFFCRADSQEEPAAFAKTVSDAGIFTNVDYTGFAAYQTEDFVMYYSFELECSN